MTQALDMPVYAPTIAGEHLELIPAMVQQHALAQPAKPAVREAERCLSWGEFGSLVNRIANRLIAAGVKPGDMVAGLSENTAEYVAWYFGVIAAGGCAVPLSGMASGESLKLMIDDCGAKLLFVSQRNRELLEPLRGELTHIAADSFISLDFEGSGWQRFDEWLRGAEDSYPNAAITPNHPFNVIYSSGTTGTPKGIVHDHRKRSRQAARMANYGFDAESITLIATPLYSNTTLAAVLPTMAFGGTLVVMSKFDARGYLELAERFKVSYTMLVPVQYERIIALPEFDRFDLSHFRVKLSTSAPLRGEVIRQAITRWPGKLFEIYGMTEGGVSAVLDAVSFPDKLDSVGRPSKGSEIRIIDDSGKEVAPGEIGEIVGRSTVMMRGYLNRDDLTREMLWQSPEGEWFYRSGDMGRFDEDGFLYILDRRKDMILSGGFNVYAVDLEQVLLKHPAVADVAVIGIPSAQWGETPLALVVKRSGSDVDAPTLLEWANGQLGKTQRISAIEFREELPRSTIGKVLKRELRAPYWEKASQPG
jgi:long-chain acyl-CoA synthetase